MLGFNIINPLAMIYLEKFIFPDLEHDTLINDSKKSHNSPNFIITPTLMNSQDYGMNHSIPFKHCKKSDYNNNDNQKGFIPD